MAVSRAGALVKAAFWIPLAVCMAVACTPSPTGIVADLSGVTAHALAFFYLSLALCFAHYPRGPVLAVAVWLLAFGVLLEIVQLLFVVGRSGKFVDLLSDAVGIGLGCAAYALLARILFCRGLPGIFRATSG